MLNKVKMYITDVLTDAYQQRQYDKASYGESLEEARVAQYLQLPPLTDEEIKQIREVWGNMPGNLEMGFPGFQIYKHYYGFDAEYVPFCYFFPRMLRVVNPIADSKVLSNKSMMYNFFASIRQPKLVARRIGGSILSADNTLITEEQLLDAIGRCDSDMIIKLSSGSSCGKSICKIEAGAPREEAARIIRQYSGDYVIQTILKQSADTAVFNASSLNTMRISTMLVDGRMSLSTAMIRFGTPGSIIDNVGAGGGCVGINDDGTLMSHGFNNKAERIGQWNGVRFAGRSIRGFDKVVELAFAAHLCIPTCGFAGWDIALDEQGEPVLIECNLIWPGLFFEQLANGKPALRDRRKDFIEYIKQQPKPTGNPT